MAPLYFGVAKVDKFLNPARKNPITAEKYYHFKDSVTGNQRMFNPCPFFHTFASLIFSS